MSLAYSMLEKDWDSIGVCDSQVLKLGFLWEWPAVKGIKADVGRWMTIYQPLPTVKFVIFLMERNTSIVTTPRKALRPHRVVKHHGCLLYLYPEDPLSPTLHCLENKKARSLGIALPSNRRGRMDGYVWAPGRRDLTLCFALLTA